MQSQTHRTLIIDDEPDARATLYKLIERFCPHLYVSAEAAAVEEACKAIREHRPSIVFLDIDLQEGTGFDILDAFPNPAFKVVFTTAHDEFAIRAFKYRALHYLLKPIDPEDLVQVTQELQSPTKFWPEYEMLLKSLRDSQPEKLSLPTLHGMVIIHPNEISHAFADDKYATVVTDSGEKIFVSLSLKEIEGLLPASEFIRPHQSWIVRIDAVRKVQKVDGTTSLLLKDKSEIPVSRRNKEAVLEALGMLGV
jgi:two-component system LytT family response regulator